MRVLYIAGWYPFPADNGARIRTFNLVRHLSGRHEVTLLAFSSRGPVPQEALEAMKPYCRSVAAVPYREFHPGRLRALLGFFSTRPRSVVDTYSPEMAALVEKATAENAFDVVVASTLRAAPYALAVNGMPKVFEEIELAVLHEQFARAHNLAAKLRRGLMWWKQKRYMAQLLAKFDGCTVVSEEERDLVGRIAPGLRRPAVVPNGVDLEINTGDFGRPHPDTLIYPGALTYRANFDAMQFFVQEILPRIQHHRPAAHLRITGGYQGVPIEQLPLTDGVELTGYLDDIRPAVAQSWACVVPLRVGGGTRLKILEAMALGTPVVSTSKGAEGLRVSHGEHILIADGPEDFARAVVRLLEDEPLRARLAANGRRLVEESYSWKQCAGHLEQLLDQIAGQQREGEGR